MTDESRLLAGRYLVGELLGRGGMSDVHRGTDTRLGRTVAVKLLKPSLAVDPAFRTRFRQEAQAAARMAHPTIVRVFDAGEETILTPDGREMQLPFIIMEYVEGRLLRDIIAEGPLDPAEAVRITSGILTALEYSHRAGVVHRDIKPGNIMITRAGQVKVMDFGIARAISDSSTTVAQTTAILGTASYFSPEQAKGESVDARTDLYSAGVVLFEMLTGRAPFRGDTAVAVAYQHVSETPAKPSSINPKVSPALDVVVAHALIKDRSLRYQSAAEFRDDVESAGSGHVPVHKEHDEFEDTLFGAPTGAIASPQAALRQLTDDETMSHTQHRPPVVWIWAGIAVVAVIVIAVLSWFFSQAPTSTLPETSRRVPTLVGKTYDEAVASLKAVQLKAERVAEASAKTPEGQVTRSDPGHGTIMTKGETVTVYVSSGTKTASVPDVRNMSIDDAQAAITTAGFTPGQVDRVDSPTIVAGIVMSTDPAQGTKAHKDDVINFVVSSGTVLLPDVTGLSVSDATQKLQGSDLQLTAIPKSDPSCPAEGQATVSQQSLAPGEVPQGSTVTLTYCTG
ncbi:Stk1 family PASTA domain-containing Ser/Thr kinase [Microbacterium sp. STN6]|uniref:Stk1 family PASTA domain-containing Ser/Thr kinase n=1 Tax=Microbacterium sp. STN6 TaxID=2995588 RepID=UPI002260F316|nr:Stk1 family PASTA domain-containing Ser/Thr kinase [Microbacterium sp. STN6]MCX7522742.1 Stk1 family PASTA domain-containing Ser/Thr kinase [Microbacterium sp. STN6]